MTDGTSGSRIASAMGTGAGTSAIPRSPPAWPTTASGGWRSAIAGLVSADSLSVSGVATTVALAPVFFATAGLRGDLGVLNPASYTIGVLMAMATSTPSSAVQSVERASSSPGGEIVRLAREVSADLVVVGATRRAAAETQFLGQTTTQILLHADATVIAVVLPEAVPAA